MTDLIEEIIKKSNDIYLITLILLLLVFIPMSAIGITCLSMLNDTNYDESGEVNNVNIIMKKILDGLNIVLGILGTIFVGLLAYIFYKKYFEKPLDQNFKSINYIYFILITLLLGGVTGIMYGTCYDIKAIADKSIAGDKDSQNSANDKITVTSLSLSIVGVLFSLIIFYLIYVFFKEEKKLINIKSIQDKYMNL